MKNNAYKGFKVNAALHGCNLQDAIAQETGMSRRKVKALLDSRSVRVNSNRVWMARHKLQRNDTVEWPAQSEPGSSITPVVLYKDSEYIIVNKPAGLLSNDGTDSVEQILRRNTGNNTLQAVHRLDRDTSGCLLFANDENAFNTAVAAFKRHSVIKIYRAIVKGPWNDAPQKITENLYGKSAVTALRVLKTGPRATYVELSLATGRKHQVRKHLAAWRHPVVGDAEYGMLKSAGTREAAVPRQMLHAYRLRIELQPGREISAQAPLPADFKECLITFRLS